MKEYYVDSESHYMSSLVSQIIYEDYFDSVLRSICFKKRTKTITVCKTKQKEKERKCTIIWKFKLAFEISEHDAFCLKLTLSI